jgi:hypothetical protein
MRWAFARRGILAVFPDHLTCGDWVIAYDEFEEAVLSARPGIFVSGYVLRVATAERTVQLGLSRSRFWEGDLPFPVRREAPAPALVWRYRAYRVGVILGMVYLFLESKAR